MNPIQSIEISEQILYLYTEIPENPKYPIQTRMGTRTNATPNDKLWFGQPFEYLTFAIREKCMILGDKRLTSCRLWAITTRNVFWSPLYFGGFCFLPLFKGKLLKKKIAWLSSWYKTFFVYFVSLLSFPFLKFNEINSFMNQKNC